MNQTKFSTTCWGGSTQITFPLHSEYQTIEVVAVDINIAFKDDGVGDCTVSASIQDLSKTENEQNLIMRTLKCDQNSSWINYSEYKLLPEPVKCNISMMYATSVEINMGNNTVFNGIIYYIPIYKK